MMTRFDKFCAIPTIIAGVVFMILGAVGLIFGCSANFTLPPILGALPFFLGWAMCVCLVKYWILTNVLKEARQKLDVRERSGRSDAGPAPSGDNAG